MAATATSARSILFGESGGHPPMAGAGQASLDCSSPVGRMSATNNTTNPSAGGPAVSATTSEGAAFSGGVAELLKGSHGRAGDGNRLTPLEERQLQSQMGAGRAQSAAYYLDREGETLEIGEDELTTSGGAPTAAALAAAAGNAGADAGADAGAGADAAGSRGKTTLMFKGCTGCTYTVTGFVAKILIDRCTDCTFVFQSKVMTSTLEVYKCEGVTLQVATTLKTIQADMCNGVEIKFDTAENFDRIVWAGTEGLSLAFEDAPDAGLSTSYTEMKGEYGADLRADIDQFIIRILDDVDAAVNERIIRLDNGFPTTLREKAAFEERQEKNMRELAKRMYGEDIVIPKRKQGAKVKPNAPCPCGSGKKYKKCCMSKPGVFFTKEQVDAAAKKGKKKKK